MLDMLESQVLTRIKYSFPQKLKDKYPNLTFTNSDRNEGNAKFPTVYIHEMPSAESGADMEGDEINAVLSAFQIEVTTNTSQSEAKTVLDEVVKIMKKLRYQVISLPEFQNTTSTYRSVARFRRTIAEDDVL